MTHQGREISLPYTGAGAIGLGKPLKSILHMNPHIPIWLGCGSEATTKLVAELCDGWLPHGWAPGALAYFGPWLAEGFGRAGGGKSLKDFEIQAGITVHLTSDVRAAFRKMKPHIALYVGGMGAREMNFHNRIMVRRGYADAAATIQELYLAGRKAEAIEAVPDEYCDEQGLIGNEARIREQYKAWADSGATGLTIGSDNPAVIELMADMAELRPRV